MGLKIFRKAEFPGEILVKREAGSKYIFQRFYYSPILNLIN